MGQKSKEILLLLFFVLISLFIFRNYFFKSQVPFPANLLVSFYEPWKSYPSAEYPSGPPNKPLGFDNLRIFYPLRSLSTYQIKNLELPLWNPYNFSGNTLLGTYQSALFHPLGIIFLILPQIDAWSLIIILQPILSGIFTYLYLRQINISFKAGFFGSVIFSFSGFMIGWWEESFMLGYSGLFLPLVLLGIERLRNKITIGNLLLLILSLTCSILSGWFQMSFYVFIFSLLYFLYILHTRAEYHQKKYILIVLISFIISLLLSGIHLVPSFEAYLFSARGNTDIKFVFDTYLQSWTHLITFLAPDFFGSPAAYNYFGRGFYHEKILFIGIPGLIFALYAFFTASEKNSKQGFFKWASIITLSLGFWLPTSWLIYYLKIPFLSVMIPSRIFYLSTFALAVLSAYGIEHFFESKHKKNLYKVMSILGVIFLAIWTFIVIQKIYFPDSDFSTVSFRNLILPTLIFLFFTVTIFMYRFNNKLKKVMYVSIIVLTLGSTVYITQKFLYFSDRQFIFPDVPVISQLKQASGINRFWGVGRGNMDSNFATSYGIFSPQGYDSFYIRRYGELLYASHNNGKYTLEIPRADATLVGTDRINEVATSLFRRRILSLLGVRFIVASKEEIATLQIKNNTIPYVPVWEDDKFMIFDNNETLPRYFFAQSISRKNNPQEILDEIFTDTVDLSKNVILEEAIPLNTNNTSLQASTSLKKYSPNKIQIDITLNSDALFFLSDNYFPGWKAFIDGNETKIYRANYSFRAIKVPAGSKSIAFEYLPSSFFAGIAVSLVGILLLGGMIGILRIKK